ncbi:MAG: signal peptidase I [Candidatus Omnitrophica bacterium]|nr:signal peptidase I [Candidatus Omnitrophota bacterium]MBU4334282.1 signal peptidase I [Candidatus Omnitrophota bacterium]
MPKVALGAVLAPFLIAILFLLVILAANWRIYSKAGHPGWASIVPIYNIYIMVKIAGKPGWWMILMFIPVVSIIIFIVINIGIAEKFGKGIGYGLGLTLLPLIFVPLLGFGSAQYISNKVVNPFTNKAG